MDVEKQCTTSQNDLVMVVQASDSEQIRSSDDSPKQGGEHSEDMGITNHKRIRHAIDPERRRSYSDSMFATRTKPDVNKN